MLKGGSGDHATGRLGNPRRADDHAGLAQRLALPELALAGGEVAGELVEGGGQGAALSGGAKPGIDRVEAAVAAQAAGGIVIIATDQNYKMLTSQRLKNMIWIMTIAKSQPINHIT